MANCTNRFYAEDQDGNELSFGVGVAIYKYYSGSWHWVINKWIDSSSGASTSLTAGGTYKAVPDTENSNYVTPDEETWTACRKDITLVYEKIICTAGDKKCIGSDVYKCNRDGTEWRLSERCPDGCTGGECDEVIPVANGFTIHVATGLATKTLFVAHVVKLPSGGLPGVPSGPDIYYYPEILGYVGGEWFMADPATTYQIEVGSIDETIPPFDEKYGFGSFADGIDCVVMALGSSGVGTLLFKEDDVFRLNKDSPTEIYLSSTSNDIISDALMGPVCDMFGIARGTACQSFWAELYDPMFIANYVCIKNTGKDLLGNERTIGTFDKIALPFAILGSLPGLSLLPFGAFVTKGLKTTTKFGDNAVKFMLNFTMDAANFVSTKDTWHFLDAIGQVTKSHADEIMSALEAGDTTSAGNLLRKYAGESKGWWDYKELNNMLKGALPTDSYNWLRTQIGLPEIGAGTVVNTAKQATLSADDAAKLADAAVDSDVMNKAVDAVYNSLKNLDAASSTKLGEVKNVLRKAPIVGSLLIDKYRKQMLGGTYELDVIYNHAKLVPQDIIDLYHGANGREMEAMTDASKFFERIADDYYPLVEALGYPKAKQWVKNSADVSLKALRSPAPSGMEAIIDTTHDIVKNQGKIVDEVGISGDVIFGDGRTVADEIVSATDEFVATPTSGWVAKGKAYTKARYAKVNTWYDSLSDDDRREKAAHAIMLSLMFFATVVIYTIYKLTDSNSVSTDYVGKANDMEKSYWLCANAKNAGSFDDLAAAIVMFRKDVTDAAKWCEDNKEALKGEETFDEFTLLVELRMIQLGTFEAALKKLGPTGFIECTSNVAFFYVALDDTPAGFSYGSKMVLLSGVTVGRHTVKIYKEGCVPESCEKTVDIVENGTKKFNCQMTEAGGCSPITNVKIYTDPLSPTTDDTVSFNGSANCGDQIDSWEWDFGDGHTATGQAVTHRYRHDDVYTVKLTVSSECTSEFTARNITVSEEGCSPITDVNIYTDPLSPKNDQIVSFNGSARSDNPFESWEWDFGDGHTATGQAVTHRYTSAGVYAVKLTVTNDCGVHEFTARNITVSEEAPTGGSTTLSIKCPRDKSGHELERCWDFEVWVDGKLTECSLPHTLRFGTGVHCDCKPPYDLIPCGLGTHNVVIKKSGLSDASKSFTLRKDIPVSWTPIMSGGAPSGNTHTVKFILPEGATLYIDNEPITSVARLSTILRGMRSE